jgi:hypothetical protein
VKKDSQYVIRTVKEEYPDVSHPESLPAVPSTLHSILQVPTPAFKMASDPTHLPYMILRCDSILSPWKQDQILAAWNRVQAVLPQHLIKWAETCSKTPAYHWGIWEASSHWPFITQESREQAPEAIAAIDRLLELVGRLMVPKIIKMTKTYLPDQWKAQERLEK